MQDFYLARQPIMDWENKIVAYDIFFRGSKPQKDLERDTAMTAATINTLINVIGIETVLGSHQGVIKISPLFLKRDLLATLPAEKLIFAVFEKDLQHPETIELMRRGVEKGYRFAINDMTQFQTLLVPGMWEVIEWLRVDTASLDEQKIAKIAEEAHAHGIKVIGMKIETREKHKALKDAGVDLFQGFYFKEPEVFEEEPISAETSSILYLWNLLRNDASTDELVEAFEKEHTITLQLLRFINSPFFSLRQTVTSVRQLITLLGREQLSQWLLLLLFATETQKHGGNQPLVLMVINRTELMMGLMKLIDPHASKERLETAYLVGMLSLIHLIFHRPQREILHHLHVSEEIERALFEGDNEYGKILQIVRLIENHDIKKLNAVIEKYGIDKKAFNRLTAETMKKVNAFDEALQSLS